LRGELSRGVFEGMRLPRWQLAVDGGGRVWYLLDEQPFGAGRGRRAGRVIIDQIYPHGTGEPPVPDREPSTGQRAIESADGG
jgi:hypothetical protein